jgi:hypothetical protein
MKFPETESRKFITWQTCLTAGLHVLSPEAGITWKAVNNVLHAKSRFLYEFSNSPNVFPVC